MECTLQCSGFDNALTSGECDSTAKSIRMQELRSALKQTLSEKAAVLSKLDIANSELVSILSLAIFLP